MDLIQYLDESLFTEATEFSLDEITGQLSKEVWNLPRGTYVNIITDRENDDSLIINYIFETDYNKIENKEIWTYPGHDIEGKRKKRIKIEKITFIEDNVWNKYIDDLIDLEYIKKLARIRYSVIRAKILKQIHGISVNSHIILSMDYKQMKIISVSDIIAEQNPDWYKYDICIIGKQTKILNLSQITPFSKE